MRTLLLFITIGLAFSVFGCSTGSRNKGTEKNEVTLHKLYPYNLHVRRPVGPGADPRASSGGADYTSHPLPNERMDCEPYAKLFETLDFATLRSCLEEGWKTPAPSKARVTASPTPRPLAPVHVYLQLKREPQPFLALVEDSKPLPPPCFKAVLSKVSVPREIFFQSDELEGQLSCYASRIDVLKDEFLSVKLPIAQIKVDLVFPMKSIPKNDEELKLWLLNLSLTPYWEEASKGTKRTIRSKVVADTICKRCMGEKNLRTLQDPPLKLWP